MYKHWLKNESAVQMSKNGVKIKIDVPPTLTICVPSLEF